MPNKYDIHMDICNDLNALYQRKNHDYGDSFGEFYAEFGLISTCMRLTDKLKRLKSFARGADMQVKDESIKDTLMDLANYSIMTLVEMEIANTKSIPQQSIIREAEFFGTLDRWNNGKRAEENDRVKNDTNTGG